MKILAACPKCNAGLIYSYYKRKEVPYIIIYNNNIYCSEDCFKKHTNLILSNVNYKKYELNLENYGDGEAEISWSEI